MLNQKWKMVITDLDGTLLNNKKEVSLLDMRSLFWLGENNIIRVIATGRNYFSVNSVIKSNFPIDYLIFSSGAGIIDWKKKQLLHSQHIHSNEVKAISKILLNHDVDFMIHEIIPDNHKFVYHKTKNSNLDFERRISIYKNFATELNPLTETYKNACQILAVLPNNIELFERIKEKFTDLKIIRTTSPLDGNSIWMEIFPLTVSKGHAVDWLCKNIHIHQSKTISIGNDYNDIDMLDYSAESYIVSNAPDDLKLKYKVCKSNQESPFYDVVSRHFDTIF